jgi:hypothetical protein
MSKKTPTPVDNRMTHFPPKMFEYTNASRKMINCLLEISAIEDEKDISRHVQDMFDILGPITSVEDWLDKYRALWMRIIAESIRIKGVDHVMLELVPFYLHTARAVLTKTFRLSQEAAEYHMEHLDDRLLYAICYWHAAGRKNYTVSKGLAQKLKRTKLRGYPVKDLKLPFGAILIDLTEFKEPYFCCIATQQENGITLTIPTRDGIADDDYVSLAIFKGDHTLDMSINSVLTAMPEERKKNKQLWRDMMSYVINVVLYATMPDVECVFEHYDKDYKRLKERITKLPKKSKKRDKLREQLNKRSNDGHYHLGGTIKVDRTEEQQSSQGFKGQRRITVRSLVSGHWRNQPCGTGKMDTKRIWIEPFWRGPEGAPITQKRHHLQ